MKELLSEYKCLNLPSSIDIGSLALLCKENSLKGEVGVFSFSFLTSTLSPKTSCGIKIILEIALYF